MLKSLWLPLVRAELVKFKKSLILISTKPWIILYMKIKRDLFLFSSKVQSSYLFSMEVTLVLHTIVGFHMTSLKFKRVLGFVIGYAWVFKLLSHVAMIYMMYFGEFCYLNSLWIRKSITLLFVSSSRNKYTPSYQNSVTEVFVGFRPPCWCPSRWAPAWRLHTNLYKFG